MVKNVSLFITILFTTQMLWYASGLTETPDPTSGNSRKIVAAKAELFHAAKKILVLNGYELKIIDASAGVLSTKATPMRVNVSGCNCEELKWGMEDKRPIIDVSVDARVDDNRIAVTARILGEYPKEQISEKMIEDDLLDQILRYLE